jgi:hypothetical protein
MAEDAVDMYDNHKQDILFYVEFHHHLPSQMSSIFEIQINLFQVLGLYY